MKNRAKGVAIGAIVIGAAGYIAGILTAPKSGRETRRDITNAREKGMAEAERHLKSMHTELNHLIGEAEKYVKDPVGRHQMNEVIEGEIMTKATRARQKAREILSAVHDGTADDKDLDKAVAEASKAIKSIRKYLQK